MTDKSIVIIDDDADALNLYRRVLTPLGKNIITFRDGQEFLDQLYRIKNKIGLILLDIKLPGLNGLVILKKVQDLKKYYKYKICVITSYNEPILLEKAKELGASDVFVKSLTNTQLLAKVQALLNKQDIVLNENTYAKVEISSTLENSPMLLNFKIIGLGMKNVLLESQFEFREKAKIDFSCSELGDILGDRKEFSGKVIKSVSSDQSFHVALEWKDMSASELENLKSYIYDNAQETITFHDRSAN